MRIDGDTIFALSSGGLPSGVAVIRISGPECAVALETLCGSIPPPRSAKLMSIRNRNGERLDHGIVLYFPGPASFSGEDSAELQIHGGRATVNAVLEALGDIPGMRAADAGEFSRRAFHNGKMDLVQVEGLADLISAETEMQRRLAAEHATGGLSTLYQSWAKRLTHARAMIEAELDFADEEDVPGSIAETIWDDMRSLSREITDHLAKAHQGEIIRDGLKVVIAGRPNSGKSSLINYLIDRDVAIVTDIPGTTRDVLSVDLDLDGYAVRFYDTAGLRDTNDPIEQEGIRRAKLSVSEAALVLLLADDPSVDWNGILPDVGAPSIRVGTKSDRADVIWPEGTADVTISSRTGAGIAVLREKIKDYLPSLSSSMALALPTRRRHRDGLERAKAGLNTALSSQDDGLDIQAEHLRVAALELGRITGRVDVENLLDVIFSEFCIGK